MKNIKNLQKHTKNMPFLVKNSINLIIEDTELSKNI